MIARDVAIDEMRANAEEVALELLALQAPVASDLRVVVSALWIVADLQRMGALAIHVAKAARRRHPNAVLPDEMRPVFDRMGRVAVHLADQAGKVLLGRDVELARSLESDDDLMDDLHREMFALLNSPGWSHGAGTAVDIALLGRFYERFADHAVAISRRVIFLVTGENVGRRHDPASLESSTADRAAVPVPVRRPPLMRSLFPAAGPAPTDVDLDAAYWVDDLGRPGRDPAMMVEQPPTAPPSSTAAPVDSGTPPTPRFSRCCERRPTCSWSGAGTARAEGYAGDHPSAVLRDLGRRRGLSPRPRMAVVTNRAELAPTEPLFTDTEVRPLVVTSAAAPRDRRRHWSACADVVVAGDATGWTSAAPWTSSPTAASAGSAARAARRCWGR